MRGNPLWVYHVSDNKYRKNPNTDESCSHMLHKWEKEQDTQS